jgi:hypothetical protein
MEYGAELHLTLFSLTDMKQSLIYANLEHQLHHCSNMQELNRDLLQQTSKYSIAVFKVVFYDK